MELELIKNKIQEIRGLQVMMDYDLAEMYGVETKVLKQAVKRNNKRFPPDFMFEVSEIEWYSLRSQIVTSNKGGNRYKPSAFTEQGVAMLSSVLHSDIAIEINIQIIRAFVQIRQYTLNYSQINQKLETFMVDTNLQFNDIYLALAELCSKNEPLKAHRIPIGYLSSQ